MQLYFNILAGNEMCLLLGLTDYDYTAVSLQFIVHVFAVIARNSILYFGYTIYHDISLLVEYMTATGIIT